MLPNCIAVGHSTGGMYLLSVPALEQHLVGLALIGSAPDATWRTPFFEMTQRYPLPEVDAATKRFEAAPSSENLRDIAVASSEWNFAAGNVARGREFLRRMPYNHKAVAWSDRHFDDLYAAQWWPSVMPTLILSGADDHIVLQSLWNSPKFQGKNILRRTVEGGSHFVWFDDPDAVRNAFQELSALVIDSLEA